LDTKTIIDKCLMSIGEPDPASPTGMTRVECLELINCAYQVEMGQKLHNIATYSYDSSDAAHTITAGIGTLPTDFLAMERAYDGDAADDTPLQQIFDID
jgi:hypothetical protein